MSYLHRIWCALNGYFWVPCPRCGRMFGGHNYGPGRDVYRDDGHGQSARLTCKRCPTLRYVLTAGEWQG